MSSPMLSLLQYLRITAANLRATTESARHVLQSLLHGMSWVMKTCLALLCVSSVGAGAYGWRASSTPMNGLDMNETLVAQAKEEAPPRRDKEKVGQPRLDAYGDPLPPKALARLGTTRFRPGFTSALAFTPDGKGVLTIAGAAMDRLFSLDSMNEPIRLWERDTGKLVRRFGDLPNFGNATVGAQGRIVAGWQVINPYCLPGNPEDVLFVWEVATGKLLHQFKGQSTRRRYALSSDGKFLATDLDGKFGLWEIATGKLLWRQKLEESQTVEAVAISPDSTSVALAMTRSIHLYEVRTGRLLQTWSDFDLTIVAPIVFSSDGSRLVVQSDEFRSVAFINTKKVHLLDRTTGKKQLLSQGRGTTFHIVCSPAGAIMAIGRRQEIAGKHQKDVSLWDMTTGKVLHHLPNLEPIWLPSVIFSPDGKTLAGTTEKGGIALWNVATGKELHHCQNSKQSWGTLTFSPDGKILAGMEGVALSFWEVASGKKLSRFRDYQGYVHSVDFTRDGKSVVSVEGNVRLGVVHIWDAQSNRERSSFPQGVMPLSPYILGACLSPNGKILAVGWDSAVPHSKNKHIDVWDVASGKKLQRLEKPQEDDQLRGHENYGFRNFVFSPDGRYLACELQAPPRGTHIALWELATGKRLQHGFPGRVMEFSPDDTTLVTLEFIHQGQDQQNVCSLWEIATGKKIGEIRVASACYTLSFAPHGQALLIASTHWEDNQTKTKIQQYTLHRDKRIGVRVGESRTFLEIDGKVDRVAFTPDSKALAVSVNPLHRGHHTIVYLEAATGKERARFRGHDYEIGSLSFSPDGRRLASGSADTTILIWDVTGQLDDRGRLHPLQLTAKQIEDCWIDLVGTDAIRANQSQWKLIGAGKPTVEFLTKKLRPVSVVTVNTLKRLVTDLDSESFLVRQKARQKLEEMGEIAQPHLRRALENRPSLQLRRSANQLLMLIEEQCAKPLSGEALRMLRAIEVLEQIGNPEARKLLEALSNGAPGARQTEEAKASLRRLAQHAVRP